MSHQEKYSQELALEELTLLENEIIIYNDDVNTFDHVIETLMSVCRHSAEQAEQCSLIIHYNGKCAVKTGPLAELIQPCTQLLEAGLSAEIQ